MRARKNIPAEDLFQVLEGIERAPELYGSTDAIESIYFALLGILIGFDDEENIARKAFNNEIKRVMGSSTNLSLSHYIDDPKEIVRSLKKIRAEVFSA